MEKPEKVTVEYPVMKITIEKPAEGFKKELFVSEFFIAGVTKDGKFQSDRHSSPLFLAYLIKEAEIILDGLIKGASNTQSHPIKCESQVKIK